jgi:hypothetical protein
MQVRSVQERKNIQTKDSITFEKLSFFKKRIQARIKENNISNSNNSIDTSMV